MNAPEQPVKTAASDLTSEVVRAQLGRIIGSTTFSRTPRLQQFLTYVCERTLAGGGDEINEFLVGVDVFERGSDFSPGDDAIAFVQLQPDRTRHMHLGLIDRLLQ